MQRRGWFVRRGGGRTNNVEGGLCDVGGDVGVMWAIGACDIGGCMCDVGRGCVCVCDVGSHAIDADVEAMHVGDVGGGLCVCDLGGGSCDVGGCEGCTL